jgi:hypothetical protein
MADLHHTYQYECGDRHYVGSHVEVKRCPVAICKHPQLKRIGKGSKGPRLNQEVPTT